MPTRCCATSVRRSSCPNGVEQGAATPAGERESSVERRYRLRLAGRLRRLRGFGAARFGRRGERIDRRGMAGRQIQTFIVRIELRDILAGTHLHISRWRKEHRPIATAAMRHPHLHALVILLELAAADMITAAAVVADGAAEREIALRVVELEQIFLILIANGNVTGRCARSRIGCRVPSRLVGRRLAAGGQERQQERHRGGRCFHHDPSPIFYLAATSWFPVLYQRTSLLLAFAR